MGALIGLLGFVGLIVGLVSLIRPLRFLRINSRKQAGIVIGISFVLLLAGVALTPTEDDDSDVVAGDTNTTVVDVDSTTTTAPDETTTTVATTTTTQPPTTTTTLPPTTTTTLPEVLAEGEGRGDDVVELDIPGVPVIIELTHAGRSNFAVWSLDAGFDSLDLLVNEIGSYEGTRPMQFLDDELVTGLEISADGDWSYVVKPLAQVDRRTCAFEGEGDDVVIVENFIDSGGAATLTNTGNSNFAIWAWGTDRDLLVNDIGPYEGTVRVSSGLFIWDITATGGWTVDC